MKEFILIFLAMTLGSVVSPIISYFVNQMMVRFYLRNVKPIEPIEPIPMSPPAEFAPNYIEMARQVYSDPQAMKALRKTFGIQSERERFEEEAEEDHDA